MKSAEVNVRAFEGKSDRLSAGLDIQGCPQFNTDTPTCAETLCVRRNPSELKQGGHAYMLWVPLTCIPSMRHENSCVRTNVVRVAKYSQG